MKRILFFTILSLVGLNNLYSQSRQRNFDGNDYIIVPDGLTGVLQEGSQTIEIIFMIDQLTGQDQVFLSQLYPIIAIGINALGEPFVEYNGVREVLNYPLQLHTPSQLSITFIGSNMEWYIDGVFQGSKALNQPIGLLSRSELYIGKNILTNSDYILGSISELRVYNQVQSPSQIGNNVFQTVPYATSNLDLNFRFDGNEPNYVYDYRTYHSIGLLGGYAQNTGEIPQSSGDVIITSIGGGPGTPCSSYSTTPTPPALTAEMLYNGDFEQYCSGLVNSALNQTYLPHQAFIDNIASSSVNPDVAAWTTGGLSSPDFYVRNGLGSIPPYWGQPFGQQKIVLPPSNTHNNLGTALVGLQSELGVHEHIKESCKSFSPSTSYVFSGWVYVTEFASNAPLITTNAQFLGSLEITLYDNSNSYTVVSGCTLLGSDNYSTNNGWQYVTLQFTTPSSFSGPCDEISITNNSSTPSNGGGSYVFLDDISVKKQPVSAFPQYIGAGTSIDYFEHCIETDSDGNVFVSGNLTNPNLYLEFGIPTITNYSGTADRAYYIAKYSSTGTLLWSKVFPYLYGMDFAIDGNDDIMVVGEISPSASATNLPSLTTTTGYSWGSHNMFVQKLNGSNGSQQILKGYGGNGAEAATAIEIDKSTQTAYILFKAGWNGIANPIVFWSGNQVGLSKILKASIFSSGFSDAGLVSSSFQSSDLRDIKLIDGKLAVASTGGLDLTNSSMTSISSSVNLLDIIKIGNSTGSSIEVIVNQPGGAGNVLHSYSPTLTSNWSKTFCTSSLYSSCTEKVLSAISTSNNIYVLYWEDQNVVWNAANQTRKDLVIEKLSASTGASIWKKKTSQINASISHYGDSEFFLDDDKLFFISDFITNGTAWTISLGNKSMSSNSVAASPLIERNSVVSYVEDLGTTATFKQASLLELTDDLIIFPNPAYEEISIQSKDLMISYVIYSIDGKVVSSSEVDSVKQVKANVSELPQGYYLLSVQTNQGLITKPFVKN